MYKYFIVFVMQMKKDVSWKNIRSIADTISPKAFLCTAVPYSLGQALSSLIMVIRAKQWHHNS